MNHRPTSTPSRAGVLTFHRCINYGSYWQARCLVDGLRARGLDAELIDHHSPRVNRAEWRCAFRPTLPTPSPATDFPSYRRKTRAFFDAFDALPRSPRFDLEDPEAMPRYDLVVVGSDEVWNLSHPWYGGHPFFYGEGVRASRLVSYAASFGNYDASRRLPPEFADRLRRFDALSVRDENSRRLVEDALGVEPAGVLDPCLQFDVAPEGEGTEGPEGSFVAVYGHNFSERFTGEVRRWAASRGLPLVSIGYRNDWADRQWLHAGPHDFARFMTCANAVATNFFHGCVFALRNEKPFACEASDYRAIKVPCLMDAVGGRAHLVDEHTPRDVFDARLDEPLDGSILDNIARLRRASDDHLDTMLTAHHAPVS